MWAESSGEVSSVAGPSPVGAGAEALGCVGRPTLHAAGDFLPCFVATLDGPLPAVVFRPDQGHADQRGIGEHQQPEPGRIGQTRPAGRRIAASMRLMPDMVTIRPLPYAVDA